MNATLKDIFNLIRCNEQNEMKREKSKTSFKKIHFR